MAGWLVLLASPIAPTFADRVSGFLIPTLLAIVYAGLVMAFWTRAKGGFDSLPNVMRLCTKPEIARVWWPILAVAVAKSTPSAPANRSWSRCP